MVWRSEKFVCVFTQPLSHFNRNICICFISVNGFSALNIANGFIKKNEVFVEHSDMMV
jgi:hypothetical protein